jgi:hypothetical protein
MTRTAVLLAVLTLASACSSPPAKGQWNVELVVDDGAVLSVWGTGEDDLWAVGGREGQSLVFHNDGTGWSSVDVGSSAPLWFVYGFGSDDVYALGERGTILHYDGQDWRRIASGTEAPLYGLWGSAGGDVWIVGGDPGTEEPAVVLHGSARGAFSSVSLPAELAPQALYKIYDGPMGLRTVGDAGTVLSFDGDTWVKEESPTREALFSLWGRADDDVFAVGGDTGAGELLHYDGEAWSMVNDAPLSSRLSGVFTAPGQPTIAVGAGGYILELAEDGLTREPFVPDVGFSPLLHNVWGDGSGTAYAVGGDMGGFPAASTGVILRRE